MTFGYQADAKTPYRLPSHAGLAYQLCVYLSELPLLFVQCNDTLLQRGNAILRVSAALFGRFLPKLGRLHLRAAFFWLRRWAYSAAAR